MKYAHLHFRLLIFFLSIFLLSGVIWSAPVSASTETTSFSEVGVLIAQRDTDILPIEDPTNFIPEDGYTGGDGANQGSDRIVGTLRAVVTFLKYLIGVLAFSWFVYAGLRMVSAGDKEEQAKAARQGALYAVLALLLVVLVEPMIIDTLYGGGDIAPGGQLDDNKAINLAISAGWRQVIALVEWVKAFLILIGFSYLLFSAWKFLQDMGGEEEISKQRTILLWMAVGFIVVALDKIIIQEVFYKAVLGADPKVLFEQNAVRGIQEIVAILTYFLQFLGVVAIGIIVYAGLTMIMSFGNEENWEKGKKTLIAAGIGFLFILMSYVLVQSVLTGNVL